MKKEITHSAQVIDLKNYLADGGVIYFVIYIKSRTEYTIYYAQLEPIKLKEILGEKIEGKKSIRLKKLPKESIDIVNIFKNFLYNRNNQMSFSSNEFYTLSNIAEMHKNIKLRFALPGLGLNKDNYQNFIDNNNVYLHATSPNFPIPIPLMEQLTKLTTIEEGNKIISIHDKVFYNKQTREHDGEKTILRFGESFKITLNKDTLTFDYNIKNNIRTLVKDLSFLILIYENNGFFIDKHFVDMTAILQQDKSFNIDKNKKALKEYEEIIELLDYLNIDGDLDLDKLTREESLDIAILQKALLNKEEVLLKKNIGITTCMKIQNHSIALAFFLKENETNIYRVEDLFQVKNSPLYSRNQETNVETVVPLYRIMSAQDLADSSNIRFDSLIERYKTIDKDPEVFLDAHMFFLQLILAADLCTENDQRRSSFLKTSLEFVDWLKEEDKDSDELSLITFRLNELQIIKRLRRFSKNEIENLVDLADSIESPDDIKFGAYVLLDDKFRATKYLNKLDSENRAFMQDYPIYNLFKAL